MLLTLLLMSCVMSCISLSVVVDVSSPDLETMNTLTHETGQNHVPDLSLVSDDAGRADSHVSSALLNDV
jgi:hypothetical protein